ncbi:MULTISPECIES: TetR/AcrR family transcriptional regulator [Nocardioides]|uniref:TetR/AcrR family transcriptional regulator n=1 Tax=Nocardioides vastitatis TaxID=2568655 RepID=A0ABW0ZKH6_9ACTN|nr:TetR/AcrR family transcriptional regulator [Nocardioides sp.]THJ16036.1 TetR/AcrR family transcriptional regulator [Nocardioides sp.]
MSSYHHGDLRDALLDAAVELARKGGSVAVGIRELAPRAGVSPTAACRHFADRDDVLRAVARVGIAELEASMLRRLRRVRGADPADRARRRSRALGQAYDEFALAEPGLFAVAFDEVTFADCTAPYQHLSDALDGCVESGFVDRDKRGGAELICWTGVHGFSMLHSTGPLRDMPHRDRGADLARILDRIEDSLRRA